MNIILTNQTIFWLNQIKQAIDVKPLKIVFAFIKSRLDFNL